MAASGVAPLHVAFQNEQSQSSRVASEVRPPAPLHMRAAHVAVAPLLLLESEAASPSAAMPSSRLKVLCLHGYSQNGAVLRDRSGGFRKPLKKSRFELFYPDGPFGCFNDGEDPAVAAADSSRRAWWRGHSGMDTYVGWDESHAKLSALWEAEQFDGVMGFSQGAGAAAMLCAERRPRFGIFVAGFVPRDEAAAAMLIAGVDGVPTLHVTGSADTLIVPARSRALASLFSDAQLVEHGGGHHIPSGPAVRSHVVDFVDRVLDDANASR